MREGLVPKMNGGEEAAEVAAEVLVERELGEVAELVMSEEEEG